MADPKIVPNKSKVDRKARTAKPPVADTAVAMVEAAKAVPAVAVEIAAKPVEAASAQAAPAKPAPAKVAASNPTPAKPAPSKPAPAMPVVAQAAAAQPEAVAAAPKAETTIKPTVNTVQAGASTMTETITNTMNKAQEATQQTAQQATEQFRGALNDANQRGKVAIEKSARLVEEMADLTRGNLEAFVASQKTAAKYVETLTQSAADYSRRSFEEASTALRSFAEAKSPTDIFRLQSDYARSAFDAMISESARVSETVVKMSGEVAEPITSRYAVAAERLKTVAA